MKKTVLIVGAGPAGLTAALELLRTSPDHVPLVIESLAQVGGLARTIKHNGNRIDIGGHRFFSKVDWVMNWWREILPMAPQMIAFSPVNDPSKDLDAADALAKDAPEKSMLLRPRLSRIFYLRKFFDYPISLSVGTLKNLGFIRLVKVGVSYVCAMMFPIKPEKNLEDFFINRFGNQLYRTFFKDYTEKVWGVECQKISAEWGAQRIKGLSITKAVLHAIKKVGGKISGDVSQKQIETSLIEKFLYPKYGPGQMWETVADLVTQKGGEIILRSSLKNIRIENGRVIGACYSLNETGKSVEIECENIISTMPIKNLFEAMMPPAPNAVHEIAVNLAYRDFITIGVLLTKLSPSAYTRHGYTNNMFPDTWIYVQESDVKVGRMQIFNNWSPAMIANRDQIWVGLEYFCTDGDSLWGLSEAELDTLARTELVKLDLASIDDILDVTVIKVEKAYPAYFGTYSQFGEVRQYLDNIHGLYPVGRNGMHRYNNQDHSMVSAKMATDCIMNPNKNKSAIWDVNVEQEYHEEKASS